MQGVETTARPQKLHPRGREEAHPRCASSGAALQAGAEGSAGGCCCDFPPPPHPLPSGTASTLCSAHAVWWVGGLRGLEKPGQCWEHCRQTEDREGVELPAELPRAHWGTGGFLDRAVVSASQAALPCPAQCCRGAPTPHAMGTGRGACSHPRAQQCPCRAHGEAVAMAGPSEVSPLPRASSSCSPAGWFASPITSPSPGGCVLWAQRGHGRMHGAGSWCPALHPNRAAGTAAVPLPQRGR